MLIAIMESHAIVEYNVHFVCKSLCDIIIVYYSMSCEWIWISVLVICFCHGEKPIKCG